jgi:FAD/FMN-containing dehydrogenase
MQSGIITKDEVKEILRGEVNNDPQELERCSRDTSIFKVRPSLIVWPKDSKDVQALVKLVAHKKSEGSNIAITGRSAGTDMTGGPLTESIVVEFTKHMNHLKELGDGYAVVEPGMYYRDFEKETLKKGLLLPTYPASRELCAMGGIVSNNSGGEKTLVYGKTEKYVESLKAVLYDGNEYEFHALTLGELEEKKSRSTIEGDIYRRMHELVEKNYGMLQNAKPHVSKNSAGYYLWNVLDKEKGMFDLTKVLVGSQGTLGLITETRFKLIRPHTHSRLLVIFLKDTGKLAELINHVLKFKPESFESYDDHTFKVAIKFFPQIMRRLKGNAITLGLQFLPEFFAMLSGGIPKLFLLAEFTADTDEEALRKAREAEQSVLEFGVAARVTKTEAEAAKYWVMRRESFNLLRQRMKNMSAVPFIDDLIVQPEDLPKFLPELYAMLDSYPLIYTIAGHMGDGNFHIIPLMDMSKPESKKIILELMGKVYRLVLGYRGSITAEHNDGLLRTPYLKEMYGTEVYRLFEETKKIFDPDNIFNPGKKVGGSREYAEAHIIST